MPRVGRKKGGATARNVPLLADTVEVAVEAIGHDNVHAEHVLPWLEAAGRDIPLRNEWKGLATESAVLVVGWRSGAVNLYQ